MSTNLLHKGIAAFSFSASYEGVCGMLIDLDLYVFSEAGELIDCESLWKGKAVMALFEEDLSDARIMIGPPIRDSIRGPITMDMIRNYQGFEVGFTAVPENHSVVLSAVPEAVWREWQLSGSWSKGRQEPKQDFLFW